MQSADYQRNWGLLRGSPLTAPQEDPPRALSSLCASRLQFFAEYVLTFINKWLIVGNFYFSSSRLVSAFPMVSFGLVLGWLTLKGGELRCGDVAMQCAHEWAVMGFGCVRIFVCSNRCRRTSSTYPSRVLPTPFSRNIGLCRHGGRDVSAAIGTKCGNGRCGHHFCFT